MGLTDVIRGIASCGFPSRIDMAPKKNGIEASAPFRQSFIHEEGVERTRCKQCLIKPYLESRIYLMESGS